jgi:hypothetical protein
MGRWRTQSFPEIVKVDFLAGFAVLAGFCSFLRKKIRIKISAAWFYCLFPLKYRSVELVYERQIAFVA